MHTNFPVNWDPGQRSLGQNYLWVLEDLLGRWRSALAHSRGKDDTVEARIPEAEDSGNIHWHELS